MKNFTPLLILFMTLVLMGCETMRGMGQDIENTGSNIRDLVSGTEEQLD